MSSTPGSSRPWRRSLADRLAEQVERLAHHALRGEVWHKALAYLRQAGQLALERSAYREAVASFERALEAVPHLPHHRTTMEQAIDLRLALRTALRPLGELGRILAVLREAESLAVTLDDPRRLGRVSIFLSIHFRFMGAYDHAIAAGQRALTLATASGDGVMQALANHYLGQVYHAQGDYRRAIDCCGQTIAYFDGVQHYERFGATPPPVTSRAMLAWCHAELGTFPEGRTLGDEGLRIAEAVNHPTQSACGPVGEWSPGAPPRQPVPCPPPPRTGCEPLSGRRPPQSISPGWRRPWGRRTPWAGASPTPWRC